MSIDVADARDESNAIAGSAPSHTRIYSLLSFMIFLWSLNYVIGKIALREFPPYLLATLRTSIAAIVILPVYAWHRRRVPIRWTRQTTIRIALLAVCGVAFNQVFFVLGLSRTSVAHSAILIGLTPVQVLLLAAATGQEKLTARKVAGLVIALVGVAVLQLSGEPGRAASLLGDIFILLCGLLLAVYTVFSKNLTTHEDSVRVNTIAYVGGALLLSPAFLWSGPRFDFAAVSAGAWLSVAYMAVFSSVISYLIYNYALSHIAASRVAAFSYLQPLLATLMAIPLLGERLTAALIVGGALVLAGVYVTERA